MTRDNRANLDLLRRLWADAVPIREFIEDQARTRPVSVFGVVEPASPTAKQSSIESLTKMLQAQAGHTMSVDAAKKRTTNDLIAGRLTCLGRRVSAFEVERIDSSFWIGSSIDWSREAVSRGEDEFVDLRIILSSVNAHKAEDNYTSAKQSLSVEDAIKAAIDDYAKQDPRLSRPPGERHRAYRDFLTSLGFRPHKDRGFSDKNFQKFETTYRKKNK